MKKTLTAVIAALTLVVPAGALAHDGDGDRDGFRHHHRHHHRVVVLKGTVSSVNTDAGTLVVAVSDTNRKGRALDDENVTVDPAKGWVADTNNDGKRNLADIQAGDKVIVFAKRRDVNFDTNSVDDAFVIDKTHPKSTSSYRSAYRDGERDGDCDRG